MTERCHPSSSIHVAKLKLGNVRNRTGLLLLFSMAEIHWKPGAQPSGLERIGKVLRETVQVVRHEPLPERWVELIKRLNAEDTGAHRRKPPERGR